MMRWRAVLILIFAAVALCAPPFAAASLRGQAGVIGVYDGTGDEPIPDHFPGLLPAAPLLPVPLGASVKVPRSAQPAILFIADPFESRAPPLS